MFFRYKMRIAVGAPAFIPARNQPQTGVTSELSDPKTTDCLPQDNVYDSEDERDEAPASLFSGRRIVELDHIIDQLKQCNYCNEELSLLETKGEKIYGFGSVLSILCRRCGKENKVDTGKRHRFDESARGPTSFVVNTKAAIGMMHSGVGHTHISNFMAAIEVPTIHHKTMKAIERKVGEHVRLIANESCTQAVREERDAILSQTSPIDANSSHPIDANSSHPIDANSSHPIDDNSSHPIDANSSHPIDDNSSHPIDANSSHPIDDNSSHPINDNSSQRAKGEFKYDMGWQKRGSGKGYNSKSGVGTMIGNKTGKICAFGVRIKDCKTCNYHRSKHSTPRHKCFKNWTGSAKAMEADVGGELAKKVEKENIDVNVLIMDDDCITMSRIRQELSHSVEKWSDQNHTVKHLGNSLYSLQEKHKELTATVIKHVQKCFNYALAQNKGNVGEFQVALKKIVPHIFGEHDSCGSWCGYQTDPQHYKHHGLPYGRPLSGAALRSDIANILDIFIHNAEKIAPAGSTKDVESFNNMVASKAPKRMHLSGSDNLLNRVAFAVAQKNEGVSYVNRLNTSLGISPGKVMAERSQKFERLRKRRSENENTREYKKRRLERKLSQRTDSSKNEIREGTTYQSGVAHSHISEVCEIPSPQLQPECILISTNDISEAKHVFCDIETTSLHLDSDIVQIAAVCGSSEYNKYISPTKPISASASAVTRFTSYGNVLFYQGKPVKSVSLLEGLQSFLSWLEMHSPCILIGHNFRKFDFPRIIRAFKIHGIMEQLVTRLYGIVDTLPLFKDMFPHLKSYSQENIVSVYVQEPYAAHNAMSDVESLKKLCNIVGVSDEQMSLSSCSTQSAISQWDYREKGRENVSTLLCLKQQKVLSSGMVDRIGQSGLRLEHLALAVRHSGFEGLSQLFCHMSNGKPRVTKRKKIVVDVYTYVKNM